MAALQSGCGSCSSKTVNKAHLAFCWLSDAAFKEHPAAKSNICAFISVFFPDAVCSTYPVKLNGVDPLLPVLWVLCSEVPHAVVYTYVQTALVKLVRLKKKTQNEEKW